MQNFLCYVVLFITTCVCLLFSYEFSTTDHVLTPIDLVEKSSEDSPSTSKSAMFNPHHHGHKMPAKSHSSEHSYHKVLPPRRHHSLPEKEPKEPMAKENNRHHRSHSDSASARNSSSSSQSNNIVFMPPIWDTHGASQQVHRKLYKFAMVEGGEGRHGRHQKKKDDDEDYYYTYDKDYETRMGAVSSKISHFLRESIGWNVETESEESQEDHGSFLRGADAYPNKK